LPTICPSIVWPNDRSRFIDDPVVALFFGAPTISLAEGTSGVPFGIDVLGERRRVFNDPGMKQLLDSISPRSAIETLTSEFIGAQPGSYAYQAWQVSNWSREWVVVYGVSDAAHDEGYPFPWLFGFCRRDHSERNFITLLREGASHFDWGFYSTYGKVLGQWRLSGMALSVSDDDEQPRWDLVDQLLSLDDSSLASVLVEGPEDQEDFLSRIDAIIEGAEEAGYDEDVSLADLLDKAGGQRSLQAIEERLPAWQRDYDAQVEREDAERQEKLLPFKDALELWITVAAGPHPRSWITGIGWGVRMRHIRAYLETYVLEHGELPTGSHDLGRTKMYNLSAGVIDFDDIAQRATSSTTER
jgi:hypothetical protein